MTRHTPLPSRGYFGIGCQGMKTGSNYGSLFRTAQVFDAAMLFLIGPRFQPQHSDTMKAWRHIPTFSYASVSAFQDNRPHDCVLVGIEMTEDAIPLKGFQHPERALYLLGAEDHGLSNEAIKACQHIVRLPGERSLNVSVAGSIVLYDRISKRG